jgi:DNA-directed RNA polymerase specialized sigma24 family protein
MRQLNNQDSEDAASETGNKRRLGTYDSPEGHLGRRKNELLGIARRKIRWFRVDPADLDAEDAVDMAYCAFFLSIVHGSDDRIKEGEFLRHMTVIIRRIVRAQKRRSSARKRSGASASLWDQGNEVRNQFLRNKKPGMSDRELDLDQIVSCDAPVADVVGASLVRDSFLELMPDERHRVIFTMCEEGHSIEAMAIILGVSRRTIERTRRDNQRIFRGWKPDL